MSQRQSTLIKRWKAFLGIAAGEVTFLNHYLEVRYQFNLIASRSPMAHAGSEFWSFAAQAFTHEMIFRICRLTEVQSRDKKGKIQKKKEVASLSALLEEFVQYPAYLSREQYLGISPCTFEQYLKKHPSQYNPPETYHYERLNKEFDDLSSPGAQHISQSAIKKDLAILGKVTKRLKAYRNKKVAHLALKKGRFKSPKLSEIDRAVGEVARIMKKYYLAINCSSNTLDFGHVDISGLFTKAWIENADQRTLLKTEFAKSRDKRQSKMNVIG